MIEVSNISKKFGDKFAVSNLSFSYKPGKVLGFIGPNGAGKSTTMKCLSALLPLDSGEIRVNGELISDDLKSYRRKFSFLPEGNPLLEELKVQEYLKLRYSLKGGSGRGVEESIELCELKDVANKTIFSLSKGFKQRTGIAAAILTSPELLFFDEPVNGLDPEQIVNMRELFQYLAEKSVLILSSHILAELELICSDFLIIANAEKKAFASKDELLNNRKKNSLYIQIEGERTNLIEKLSELPFIEGLKEDNNNIIVDFSNNTDPRNEIFEIIRNSNQISLKEFYIKQPSLENIYMELINE